MSKCPVCTQPLAEVADECPQCGSDLVLHRQLSNLDKAMVEVTTNAATNAKRSGDDGWRGSKLVALVLVFHAPMWLLLAGVVTYLVLNHTGHERRPPAEEIQSNEVRALIDFTEMMKMTVEMLNGERQENRQLRDVIERERRVFADKNDRSKVAEE